MLRGRYYLRPSEPELGNSSEGKQNSVFLQFANWQEWEDFFMSFSKMFEKVLEIKPEVWALMIAIILGAFLVSMVLKDKEKFNAKILTYGSICIALSFVLSYIRLYKFPQGGSITLGSMIPIMFFAYMFGPGKGIAAGLVYGLLQYIQEPVAVHWVQVILDYPLAFGAIGLAGCSKDKFPLGMLIGGASRWVFNVLSGVFFFASYAPPEMNPVVYSMQYNGLIVGPDILICMIIVSIPQFKNALNRVKNQAIV